MFEVVRKIHSLLCSYERRKFYVLVFTVIAVGLLEVAGIASIMPFMAVVANPQVIDTNAYLNWVYTELGFSSQDNFLIFLGFMVFAVLVLCNSIKALALYLELNFVHFRLHTISRRLLFSYLGYPYTYFLRQNTAVCGKNILQEVQKYVHDFLRPYTQILSRSIAILFIIGLLVYVDPILATVIVCTLGGAYCSLYLLTQKKLKNIGQERFIANEKRSKIVSDAFGGIKELKVLGREQFFFDYYSQHSLVAERKMISQGVIAQLPRYVMEILSFGGILIIVLYFLMLRQDIDQALPIMALYAFAGYRLMPALQGIYTAASLMRFNLAVLDKLHHDLRGATDIPLATGHEDITPMVFKDRIEFNSVDFSYSEAKPPILKDFNLTLKKNTSIGLVGKTGAGKTTLVDILLGLLQPQSGCIEIDGNPLTPDNMVEWQKNIGYVPQTIFLSDDTLAANIALGVPPDCVDMAAVTRAAKIANLHDFVMNELPDRYSTNAGERGVCLSGGQRQRIGIARAIYHDPDVLIMDEATSSLDGITEEAVIDAIRTLSGEKTIITIAHRLPTLSECDVIYVMDKGVVMEQGSYQELSSVSGQFRAMGRA